MSGWQEGKEQATDLTQLSASFKIDKGQAVTTDLNLVGPLVRMTGVGTVALDTKQIGFRVEPKLVMTTEGQGRADDPVGFGIPVMIEGPWGAPRIYPDMQGILDNPDAAYAKLKEMGKGLFGPNGGGLECGAGRAARRRPTGWTGPPAAAKARLAASRAICSAASSARPSAICCSRAERHGPGRYQIRGPARDGQARRGRTARAAFRSRPADAEPAAPAAPAASTAESDAAPQDSQAMNEVLRQLFNR